MYISYDSEIYTHKYTHTRVIILKETLYKKSPAKAMKQDQQRLWNKTSKGYESFYKVFLLILFGV